LQWARAPRSARFGQGWRNLSVGVVASQEPIQRTEFNESIPVDFPSGMSVDKLTQPLAQLPCLLGNPIQVPPALSTATKPPRD